MERSVGKGVWGQECGDRRKHRVCVIDSNGQGVLVVWLRISVAVGVGVGVRIGVDVSGWCGFGRGKDGRERNDSRSREW